MKTLHEQLGALESPVEDWAIKKDKRVKGLFTSVDFVTFKLNQVFTPSGWSFTILDGPRMITINESNAYAQVIGRLEVRFADGAKAHQDDVGIWPLTATGGAREGRPLTDTAPERYETVLKAARTDCLKNAARNLGSCFAPLADIALREAKRRAAYQNCDPEREEGTKPSHEHIAELFGEDARPETPPAEKAPTNGLDRLFAEVNLRLAANGLEQYTSKENMIKALKAIGHCKYSEASHATMVGQLIAKKEPN